MSSDQIVTIVLADQTYEVNKKKLIENSDYFRALYSSGMRESTENFVQLQELSVIGLGLVLEFITSSKIQVVNETLADLIEAASFLQVTSILKLLSSEIRLENCVELYSLSEVYGAHDLVKACLKFMSCYYHPVLKRSEFSSLSPAVRSQIKEMRMKGTATLIIMGEFTCLTLGVPNLDEPWSMLWYGEMEHRWKPLAKNLPPPMVDVRGFGSAVLDNYLFVVGGYRMISHEISGVHRYNPWRNEWNRVASLNQKRSNFQLVSAQGKLYALGGQCLSSVECYVPEQDWWTFVSSMPDALTEFSACECQGMIYVMGGYTAKDRNTNLLRYCPTSDMWIVFRSCPLHIRKQQMLSVEDTIYLVGGYTHQLDLARRQRQHIQTEDVLTVQSYNVTTGEWIRLKETACKSGLNLTCVLHNDGIYLLSRDVSLPDIVKYRVSLKYNIFSGAWESFRRIPALVQNMSLYSLYFPNDL